MSSVRSNRNFILVFGVVAVLFLIYGVVNFHEAFPEIGIDFKVPREEAVTLAEQFLQGRGVDLTGYRRIALFNYAGGTKVYLERELGVPQLVSLAQDTIDVWHWRVRFYKTLQKLEYSVYVDPSGRITGFQRKLEENAAGPTLDSLAARALAEAFIIGPMGVDLAKWDPASTGFEDRPARRDWSFEYELRGFKAKEAPYRMRVQVQGAEVGYFQRHLRVPDEWWREWENQRSQNTLYQTIDEVLAFLTMVLIFIFFLRHIKAGQITWRFAIYLAGALTVALFLAGFNTLPLSYGWYETTDSFGAHVGEQLLFSLLGGLVQGLQLLLLIGAGEWLYRQYHPGKLYLPALFTKRGFQSREMFQATLVGYLMAAFHIGFVVLFYVVGKGLGFWAPADVKYSNAVSTAIPWIYPLAISMMAALSEEFWFRLWGVHFFKKWTHSTALGVIIPAFIWGFLHSVYPQQPGFVRGIEVGLIGIVAGVVMLRFGIWATLTWHFVIDAIFIGLFLFQSSNAYFWISGLIVVGVLAIPAIVAVVVYLRRHALAPVDDLLNQAIETPPRRKELEAPAAEEAIAEPTRDRSAVHYQGLSPAAVKWATIVGVIGLLLMVAGPAPREFGDKFKPTVDRVKAIELATAALVERYRIDPDTLLISARLPASDDDGPDSRSSIQSNSQLSYVKRHGTLDDAERIFLSDDGVGRYSWSVVFKREKNAEWYSASVRILDGRVILHHILPDSAAGPIWPVDSARTLAQAAFEREFPDHANWHILEENSHKLPNRLDWNFTYETLNPVVGEAHFRANVSVRGSEVISGGKWLKVPETWERHEEKRGIGKVVLAALLAVIIIGALVYAIAAFGRRFKRQEIEWRTATWFGVATALLALVAMVNGWADIWSDYRTSIPVATFLTTRIATLLVGLLLGAFLTIPVIALVEALIRERHRHSAWFGLRPLHPNATVDGMAVVFGVMGVMLSMKYLFSAAEGWLGMPVHSYGLNLTGELEHFIPWLSGLTSGLGNYLQAAALLFVVILFQDAVKAGWLRGLLIAVIASVFSLQNFGTGGNLTTGEMVWQAVQGVIWAGAIYYLVTYWVGGRLWALIAGMIVVDFYKIGGAFTAWEGAPWFDQGVVLKFLAAGVFLYVVILGSKARKIRAEVPSGGDA
ncbi:MAG: CPBP family intramembrane metalloprotease [Calditrichaeota bacterium]|nr:CPBP family intramembrane metalloprotease [Calditrichota bacterium]